MYKLNEIINTVVNDDCVNVLKDLPDKSIDICLCDPPYGMNFQSNYRQEKYDKIAGDNEFPLWIFDEFKRIATKAIYVFCRWDNLHELPTPKSVLVWVKNNWSMGDLKHEHGRQWEAICFYPLEKHEFIKRIPDVLHTKRTGNMLHPTEKPVDLMGQIIRANKGDLIFDPFAGSGSTLVACQNLKRNFIGIEIDEKYCNIARDRLKQQILI